MKMNGLQFVVLAIVIAMLAATRSVGGFYRDWDLEHRPEIKSKVRSNAVDVSSYQRELATFEDRLLKLKFRRDRLPRDTAQYIDLDQSVKELSARIRIAKREVSELAVAGPAVRDSLQSTVNLEIAQIQSGFDSMQAE